MLAETKPARQGLVEFDRRRKQGYLEALERMREKPRSEQSRRAIDELAKEIEAR
jgi:adenylate kinase